MGIQGIKEKYYDNIFYKYFFSKKELCQLLKMNFINKMTMLIHP